MQAKSRRLNILLNVEKSFIPKAEYVFRTFCRILGLKPRFFYNNAFGNIHIAYGKKNYLNAVINIVHSEQATEFFDEGKTLKDDDISLNLFRESYLPFLFSKHGEIFHVSNNHATIHKDIISSSFYFLTCWQEKNMEINVDNRYDFKKSLHFKFGLADIPVVDRYCEIFRLVLVTVLPEFITTDIWPERKKFALSLSHDYDYLEFWTDKHINHILNYNLKRLLKQPHKAIYKLLAHFITKRIFKLTTNKANKKLLGNKKFVSPTHFFLTNNGFDDERQNYFEQSKEKLFETYQNEQVGLHASPSSAYNVELLIAEKQKLIDAGFDVKGIRFHYLHFNYQKTFEALEKAGFEYDSTLSWWEQTGYRAGISYPFYPFNLKENRPFNVLEIPLIIMDTSLYSSKALKLSAKKAFKRIKILLDNTARYNGHISLLWHNTSLDGVDYPGYSKLLTKTLKYTKKSNGWMASLEDLYKWWLNK